MLGAHAGVHSPTRVYATFNNADKGGGVTLSNGNRTVAIATTPTDGGSVRSTIGKSTGKWYWEFTVQSSQSTVAVMNLTDSVAAQTYPGLGSGGWMYYGLNGNKYNNGGTAGYGATFTTGDVIGVKLDMTAGTIEFLKNNVSQGVAYSGLTGTLYAATGNYSLNVTLGTANFGASAFTYTVPSGYNSGLYN